MIIDIRHSNHCSTVSVFQYNIAVIHQKLKHLCNTIQKVAKYGPCMLYKSARILFVFYNSLRSPQFEASD